MGLSRNKVAVSEGAAGSPPFYGELAQTNRFVRNSKVEYLTKDDEIQVQRRLLFNFEGNFCKQKTFYTHFLNCFSHSSNTLTSDSSLLTWIPVYLVSEFLVQKFLLSGSPSFRQFHF